MDVWKDIKRGSKVVIWCDGLKDYSQSVSRTKHLRQTKIQMKRDLMVVQHQTKRREEREDKVSDTLKQLREKHGNSNATPYLE